MCRFARRRLRSSRRSCMRMRPATSVRLTENRLWLGTCLCYGPTPVGAAIAGARDARAAHGSAGSRRRSSACSATCTRWPTPRPGSRLPRSQRRDPRGARNDVSARGPGVNSARIEVMAGDLDSAERQLRWGYEQFEQIGETEVRSTMAAMLAQVCTSRGATTRPSGSRSRATSSPPPTTSTRSCSGARRSRRCAPAATASRRRASSPSRL